MSAAVPAQAYGVGSLSSMCVTPAGELWTGSSRGNIRVWELAGRESTAGRTQGALLVGYACEREWPATSACICMRQCVLVHYNWMQRGMQEGLAA